MAQKDDILLPNNDPSLDSAQRVSAAALYAQEQAASLPKAPAPPAPMPSARSASAVPALETYQGDVEKYIQDQNVSTVSIAASEAHKRAQEGRVIETAPRVGGFSLGSIVFIAAGIALLAASLSVGAWVYVIRSSVPVAALPQTPYIVVDDTRTVALTSGAPRAAFMQELLRQKNSITLPLGGVVRLEPTADAQTFFAAVAPDLPAALARTIGPQYLLGVHAQSADEPFLIFSVDSYEGGYAGMLAWEPYLSQDLSPLFGPALGGPFIDQTIDNHEARAIIKDGSVALLWTFLNKTTILIAANEHTLGEVVARLESASAR